MARKSSKSAPVADQAEGVAIKTTAARKSSVPPKAKANTGASVASPVSIEITSDMIAERAYHLWRGGMPGGEIDHWVAAERELRGK